MSGGTYMQGASNQHFLAIGICATGSMSYRDLLSNKITTAVGNQAFEDEESNIFPCDFISHSGTIPYLAWRFSFPADFDLGPPISTFIS